MTPLLDGDVPLGDSESYEKPGTTARSLCGETRTTERVYQIGSVTFTMRHFVCIHERRAPLEGG